VGRQWVPGWIEPLVARPVRAGRTLFLSDLHLGSGPDDEIRRKDLRNLMESTHGYVDDLVLGGDVFEFWWEWKHAFPSGFFDVLLAIRDASRSGVRVRFIAGNHDFAIGPGLASFCEAEILPDGICLEVDGSRWLLIHGDATPPSECGDRLVRRILRSKGAQAAWGLLPADIAFRFALGVGKTSRWVEPGPAPSTVEMEPMARFWMRRFGLTGVVHGHTHRALLTAGPEGTYVNNGDWVQQRTAVWIDGSVATLVDCSKEGHPWRSNG
jgi:UDP-2,3-diacylglucosamine hydrolase